MKELNFQIKRFILKDKEIIETNCIIELFTCIIYQERILHVGIIKLSF